ncbi:Hint domain-containing protein [Kitasatospora sp. A2-31]|uniref:Hint domain-containing protein n=1 Tax=Kitasatospora sp. A2-31 TaxID=2916414 RepID=UPI001EEAB218|nr:Hint domain-containing protein [Kitasatospora sp. A2-31]MCG6495517.1 hypothetical protein [Kitasatospora sp. A2-31]
MAKSKTTALPSSLAIDYGAGWWLVCHSFLGDTEVLMANGERRAISEVAVGDEVLATDPQTGLNESRPVTEVIVTPADLQFTDLELSAFDITGTGADQTEFRDHHLASSVLESHSPAMA